MDKKVNLDTATRTKEGANVSMSAELKMVPRQVPFKKKPRTDPVKAKWCIDCDVPLEAHDEVPFMLFPGGPERHPSTYKIKAPDVPEDSTGYYGLRFRLVVKKKTYRELEYAIFPETIKVTAQYRHKGEGERATRLVEGKYQEYQDGDTVPDVPFRLCQGLWKSEVNYSKSSEPTEVPVHAPTATTVVVEPPWALAEIPETSPYDLPRNRVIEVYRRPYKLRIKSQAGQGKSEAKPYRHYVNQPQDFVSGQGVKAEVRIEADAESGGPAQPGDKVFYRVSFAATNSKRDKPAPGVEVHDKPIPCKDPKLAPGEGERVFEGELEVDRRGEASFELVLGLAGGDMCKVEVGTSKDCLDDTTWIQTWRKIRYELDQGQHSGPDRVTDVTWVGNEGFPAATIANMKEVFDPCFIEVECVEHRFFDRNDLDDGGKFNVMDISKLENSGKGRICVMSEKYAKSRILDKKSKYSKDKTAFSLLVTDYLIDLKETDYSIFVHGEGYYSSGYKILPHVTENTENFKVGSRPIRMIAWSAYAYLNPKTDKWVEITDHKHPGAAFAQWSYISDTKIIAKVLERQSWRFFKVSLPKGEGLPGVMRQPDGRLIDKGHQILIEIVIRGCAGESYLGGARNGCGVLCTRGKASTPVSFAKTLVHEMGHNMGMTWMPADAIAEPKLKNYGRNPEYAIPGIDPPKGVPKGIYYAGHGHQGTHCIDGASVDRREDSFESVDGTCIMYGEGKVGDSSKRFFCTQCTDYLKAEDLRDVRKKWEG